MRHHVLIASLTDSGMDLSQLSVGIMMLTCQTIETSANSDVFASSGGHHPILCNVILWKMHTAGTPVRVRVGWHGYELAWPAPYGYGLPPASASASAWEERTPGDKTRAAQLGCQ